MFRNNTLKPEIVVSPARSRWWSQQAQMVLALSVTLHPPTWMSIFVGEINVLLPGTTVGFIGDVYRHAFEHSSEPYVSRLNATLGNANLGTFTFSRATLLSNEESDLLRHLVDAATYSLKNVFSYQQAVDASQTDPLTRVGNRLAFDRRSRQEWQLAKRYKHHLSILMIDVDHFKHVNDTYGHLVGDRLLRNIAQVITMVSRETDGVFRFGGDEFSVLLQNTPRSGAQTIAERIRDGVGQIDLQRGSGTPVTVSIGVASRRIELNQTFESLLTEADSALLRAKCNGRHRVELANTVD